MEHSYSAYFYIFLRNLDLIEDDILHQNLVYSSLITLIAQSKNV